MALNFTSRENNIWTKWTARLIRVLKRTCHESWMCYLRSSFGAVYTYKYMYIHCAFPASLRGAARTFGKQTYATCQARFARKIMSPPLELCTTVIRCTVIKVRRRSFFLPFFFTIDTLRSKGKRERERDCMSVCEWASVRKRERIKQNVCIKWLTEEILRIGNKKCIANSVRITFRLIVETISKMRKVAPLFFSQDYMYSLHVLHTSLISDVREFSSKKIVHETHINTGCLISNTTAFHPLTSVVRHPVQHADVFFTYSIDTNRLERRKERTQCSKRLRLNTYTM